MIGMTLLDLTNKHGEKLVKVNVRLLDTVQQKSATRNEYASCAKPTTDIGIIAAKPKSYASELSNSSLCIL